MASEAVQGKGVTPRDTGAVGISQWLRARTRQEPREDTARAGLGERAGLMPWAPIWLGCGIGLWFALPFQPGWGANLLALIAGLAGLVAWRRVAGGQGLRLAGFALMFFAAGFALTSLRAARVDAPVLGFRYYGPIEGRVIEIDRSARDRTRLTLDQVRLDRFPPERLPDKLRISLPDAVVAPPVPGTIIMLTGHLGPPPGPAEPGGFDFRRSAWFEGLGAVGYTRAPVLVAAPPQPGGALRLHRLRMALSGAMQDRIGGQAGAVAAALMTGDRSGISEATNQMMRDSNLYHIISISGLHMGMLAGFVFAATRLVIVAVQAFSGRGAMLPAHKIAAVTAVACAAAYLWLSGGGVATERAFLMVAVMLGAVLAGRRALSLRSVALAALVILALAPEALLTPGFQMSFAATVALILAFAPWQRWTRSLPWWLRPVLLLLFSSLIAGLATSPIAAAHFGRVAHYGVLANLLVVPVTGILIMPMGPIAALLAPFGLAGAALWLMGLGVRWMLGVGEWIAGLDGAVSQVVQPDPLVLPLMGLGALLVLLCWHGPRTRSRHARVAVGAALFVAGGVLWATTTRPMVLIAAEGEAVGVMTAQGRAPSRQRGGAFTVEEWLEKDGDATTQPDAAARPGWSGPVKARQIRIGATGIVHLTGKGSDVAARQACRDDIIIVSDQQIEGEFGACQLFDLHRLRQTGAIAITGDAADPVMVTAAEVSGVRPWSR